MCFMKEVTVEQLAQHAQETVDVAQRERLLIVRDGKPVALLYGMEFKDQEDACYEASPEFWKMIEERRREPTVPLEEVEAELFAGKDLTCHYSMIIQWSDADKVFVVTLPEFGGCQTHGSTYEEAAKQGREVLEMLIEGCLAENRPLPEPATLQAGTPNGLQGVAR
jgi:predicted RNase H-like HicB family nuclease/PHD/YefM family antitoxin component YafN of YafNO toxin-antitoxin module